MKVLQICPKPPLPAIDGGCLASYHLSLNLMDAGADLKILSMATEKHPFQPSLIDDDFSEKTDFEAVKLQTDLNPFVFFLSFFSETSVQKNRFYQSTFLDKLLGLLSKEDFDIIVFDGLMTTFYLDDVRQKSKAKLIYRSHNLEHYIFKQLAKKEGNYLKSKYINWQSIKLEKYEEDLWKTVDAIWSISSFDSVVMRNSVDSPDKVHNLPFSLHQSEKKVLSDENTLFHLGAMDWLPNVEGVKWFIKNVWPGFSEQHKEMTLHLGGKSIEYLNLTDNTERIVVHDHVADANAFYDAYNIMIVPIKAGSGIRIKLIQALAKGKVIVGTKRGVMGIPAVHGEHMMISDSAEEMLEHLNKVVQDEDLRTRLSANARKLFEDNYEFHRVSKLTGELLNSETN